MNRIERYLMIATNVAVLVGLLFVAFEFRQNRHAIEIEQQMSIAEVNSQISLTLAANGEFAELVSRANQGAVEAFSAADHLRILGWVNATLEPRLSYYFLRDSGFLPEEDWCDFMSPFIFYRSHSYFRGVVDQLISYAEDIEREIAERCPKSDDV